MSLIQSIKTSMVLGFSVLSIGICNGQSVSEQIVCPAKMLKYTEKGNCGTEVTYSNPFENVAEEKLVEVQNNHESGSYFEHGESTVYYKATDYENSTHFCIFKVKVKDLEKPSFTDFPEDLTVKAMTSEGAYVVWEEPEAEDNCGVTSLISDVSIGDFLPIGTTTVTYYVYDSDGNYVRKSFNITVQEFDAALANSDESKG